MMMMMLMLIIIIIIILLLQLVKRDNFNFSCDLCSFIKNNASYFYETRVLSVKFKPVK